ncbi:MAG: nuclear transport factor 2 family protein [Flavobacteriaceae bacterium]
MKLIVTYSLFFIFSFSFSQVEDNSELFKTLKAKDSLLFDRAFNACESEYLEQLISEDFEFYHDQGGITVGKESFLKVMKNGICNPTNTTKSRRELETKSLKVFPLYNNGKLYGAIQMGTHRFFEKTGNSPERAGSTAAFTHLWILENEAWKLSRVLSYNHH